MSNLTIGLLGCAGMLVLIGFRVPVALALGSVSLIGLISIRGLNATLGIFGNLPMEFGASWTLSAVPMFLLMGAIAYHSGMTSSIFQASRLWLGRLPGGLAVATNFASAGFAAASGSSMATCAAMGRLAIPEMLKQKYDPGLAAGCVAASGTLGALIPPSIIMVIYGWFSGTSIGALLLAGILPGLLTALIYSVMIVIRCSINPELAPKITEHVTWGERFAVLTKIWPIPLLVLMVVGTIYGGFATATEAAALGAFFALMIAAVQGSMNWSRLKASVIETLSGTASIFFIAIAALLFTRFLAFAGVPGYLASQIGVLGLDHLTIILGVSVIYLILGCFLDPMGVMLLTLPVLLPIFEAADINMIWAGIIVIKYLEIGLITPPVGMNAYVVNSVVGDKIKLQTIFKGIVWFLVAEVFIMALLIAFPQISTFLPDMMIK